MYDASDPLCPTPEERGAKARQVLTDYEPHSDPDTAATDLLADLLHLLDTDVFEACLSSAYMHYEAERDEAAV